MSTGALLIICEFCLLFHVKLEVGAEGAQGCAHLGQVCLGHGLAQVVVGDEAAVGAAEGLKVALGAGPELVYVEDEAEQGADPRRALFERLAERGWPILALRSTDLTLEEVFISLTNGTYTKGQKLKKSNEEVNA